MLSNSSVGGSSIYAMQTLAVNLHESLCLPTTVAGVIEAMT